MVLTITRTGGFTGISITKTIDTASLPDDQQKEIEALIQNKHITTKKSPTPDSFTYSISVEGEITETVIIAEQDMTEEQKNILHTLWGLDSR